jgi:hypothetical protein
MMPLKARNLTVNSAYAYLRIIVISCIVISFALIIAVWAAPEASVPSISYMWTNPGGVQLLHPIGQTVVVRTLTTGESILLLITNSYSWYSSSI